MIATASISYAMSSTHPRDMSLAAYERARREARRHKQLVCKGCGLIFTATRHDARFCSNACRQRAFRRRTTVNDRIKLGGRGWGETFIGQ